MRTESKKPTHHVRTTCPTGNPLLRKKSLLPILLTLIISFIAAAEKASAAQVTTDRADYPPGSTAYITGSGFAANELVTLQVIHADGTPDQGEDHEPWKVMTDADGVFETSWHVCEDDCLGATLIVTAVEQASDAYASATFTDGPPSADLDQIRNGPPDDPISPSDWVNGNAGAEQAHYLEGFSIGYRAKLSNIPTNTEITLILGYDTRQSDRNAIDYLTHYQRLEDHTPFSHPAEVINPLLGMTGVSATVTTFPIPAPSTINSPVVGQPLISFTNLPASERVMTLFGGTISSIVYTNQESLTNAQAETQIAITFTADSETAVLAWGGHIASREDWGFTGTTPNSAGGIMGSSYHMKLVDWSLKNLGSQDRSLAATAVVIPPPCALDGPTTVCSSTTNTYVTTNLANTTYRWSLTNNTSGAAIIGPTNGTSLAVSSGVSGSYTVVVTLTRSGASTTCVLPVTVNAAAAATPFTSRTNCSGSTTLFSTTASGAGPFSFVWRKNGGSITGATTSSLTLTNLASTDAGTYCVEVSGACGAVTNCATVTVLDTASSTALDSLTNCPGTTAVFNTTPGGSGPFSFVWKKDGSTLGGRTTSSLTLTNVQSGDAANYCVEVTGACGSVTNCGHLTVLETTTSTALNSLTNCPGTTAFFSTTASGTGPFSFVWRKNGLPLAGSTTSSLTLNNVQALDTATYCVEVTGACGSVTNCGSLTVLETANGTDLTSLTNCPGSTAVFSTTPSGTGPFSFVWKKNGGTLTGSTTSSITLNNVQASDTATYCVEVTGTCGSVTNCASLRVLETTTSSELASLTNCPGTTAVFSTTPSGTGPFTFVWRKNGGAITGSTTASFTVENVQATDVATYCVEVTGACGSATNCATLNVLESTASTELTSVTNCPGTTAVFSTTPSGTGPFTFVWTKDGAPVAGSTTSSITINNVETADAGTYCVEVTGACGSVTNCGTLTVNQSLIASSLSSLDLCPGSTAVFTTAFSGTGPFTFVWKKDGNVVSGATTNTLTITNVQSSDVGTYCVEVSGTCGNTTNCASLTVKESTIVSALGAQTICAGDIVTFNTGVSGTGPFNFSWSFQPAGGATIMALSNGIPGITVTSVGTNSTLQIDTTVFTNSVTGTNSMILNVEGECGFTSVLGELRVENCNLVLCSLTQGFYGNLTGKFMGIPGPLLVNDLLNDIDPQSGQPGLVVGVLNVRSLTFTTNDALCLVQRMPGGGSATTLPSGDLHFDPSSCTTTNELGSIVSVLVDKKGKFRNVLLAQTIALSLNVRLETGLSAWPLSSSFCTQGAIPDGNGGFILGDPSTIKSFNIPPSVFNALTTLSLPLTVDGLLDLANLGLAGAPTGGASLSDISNACGTINEAFDQCRFLVACPTE